MAKKSVILDNNEKEMKKRKKGKKLSRSTIIKASIAGVLVIGVLAWTAVSYINNKNSYIATVAGYKLLVDDFRDELGNIEKTYLNDADVDTNDSVAVEAFWQSKNEDGVGMRLAAKKEALKNLVEKAVMLDVAEKKGITVSQIDKATYIKEAESNAASNAAYYNSSYGTNYNAEQFIENYYGLTYPEYKRLYIESKILGQLEAMVKAGYEPEAKQLKEWYEKDKDSYDLHYVETIFVSYQGTDEDDKTIMLEGDKLKEKKDKVAAIEEELSKKEKTFLEIAEYKDNDEGSTSLNKLKMIESDEKDSEGNFIKKISVSNTSADMTEVNKWLNETGIKDNEIYVKKEVKGISSGSFKDEVIGVYFIKYDTKVDYDTQDNEDATSIRATVRSEVLGDMFKNEVEKWAEEYEVVFNGNIYKDFKVAGFKAE